MKPISDLSSTQLKNIKAICFDCDGVLVKRGTKISQVGRHLSISTYKPSKKFLQKVQSIKSDFHIVLNSGRSLSHLLETFSPLLWDNISIIAENGLFVYHQGLVYQTTPLTPYELNTISRVRKSLQLLLKSDKRARGFEPKQLLTSFHCWQSIPKVPEIVHKHDYQNQFYCWWNDEAYDINPTRINKAFGLRFLSNLLQLTPENFLTVGNGINDNDMNRVDGISITTDPANHPGDYSITGEHLGGEIFVDHLLSLSRS